MSISETVPNVVYSTMRGQLSKDIYAADEFLVEAGEFKFAKSKDGRRPKVFMHNDPRSRLWGRSGNDKKVRVPKRFLDALRHTSGEKHWERLPDGSFKKMHTLIVAENDPTHLYNISQMFARESGDILAGRVKLVIFNSSNMAFADRMANAMFPSRWTVIEAGRRPRPATDQEIHDWHHQKETQIEGERWAAAQAASAGCDSALTKGAAR
jgi:hypothetical protein